MVQIMRKLIEAERLGNWYLHLQAVSEIATISPSDLLTQETANYGSFFGYSLEMKIPVANSFGFYQLAHNLYHVDVLCPQGNTLVAAILNF